MKKVKPCYVVIWRKEKGKILALRAYRTRDDLTQKELAEKVGIPQRHISEMENGKRVTGKEMAKLLKSHG